MNWEADISVDLTYTEEHNIKKTIFFSDGYDVYVNHDLDLGLDHFAGLRHHVYVY